MLYFGLPAVNQAHGHGALWLLLGANRIGFVKSPQLGTQPKKEAFSEKGMLPFLGRQIADKCQQFAAMMGPAIPIFQTNHENEAKKISVIQLVYLDDHVK